MHKNEGKQDGRKQKRNILYNVRLPQTMSNNRDVNRRTPQKLVGERNHTFLDGNEPLGRSSNHCDSPGPKSNLICYSHDGHNTH